MLATTCKHFTAPIFIFQLVFYYLHCSFGLTGITVIIKGLSSGFYQPSTGIKWISLVSPYIVHYIPC